jgi:hypothetical protein
MENSPAGAGKRAYEPVESGSQLDAGIQHLQNKDLDFDLKKNNLKTNRVR